MRKKSKKMKRKIQQRKKKARDLRRAERRHEERLARPAARIVKDTRDQVTAVLRSREDAPLMN